MLLVVLSGLSDAERCAYLLADSKLVENAGWDRALLFALELKRAGASARGCRPRYTPNRVRAC
jgi:hypothetical protein